MGALPAVVRQLRERAQLTQEELAARSGLSVGTIRGLESGRIRHPRASSIRQLANALGLSDDERARLTGAGTGPETTGDQPPRPAQLPAAVSGFTGRSEALERLDAILDRSLDLAPATVVISAIAGTAGVGKTALAVHWAHRVAHRFPDGQLYIDLRGFGPEQPVDPAHALGRFLEALGASGRPLPATVDELAARYRTEVAHRRMLIVLDNAASAEQVRPLLPGSSSCAVVVTSRDGLAGLVARDGAHRVELDLLSPTEAVDLLHTLVGERVRTDPAAAARLAEQCVRLPLALRVAAELAVSRPETSLAQLVAELADRNRRLELLDAGGDPRATVAGVFSWSLGHLPAATARAFALLGLHAGPDIDRYALAALADTDPASAGRQLEELTRAHLAHRTGRPGRYGLHDLLRAYAGQLCVASETGEARHAAQTRMLDYYLGTAAAAMDLLHPAESPRRPRIPRPTTGTPELLGHDDALGWLDEHRAILVQVTRTAADGWPTHATRLASTLARYLDGGHSIEALAVAECAHRAAQATGDRHGQGEALFWAGWAHYRQARYGPAAEHYEQALALLRDAGHRIGQAQALNGLGAIEQARGRVERAAEHHRQALDLYRLAADPVGEASTLSNLGLVAQRSGHHQQAADHFGQALAVFRRLGDLMGEAIALDNLGTALTRLGQPDVGADHHRQALTIARKIGDRHLEMFAHNGLGEAAHATGRNQEALAHHRAALADATALGGSDQEARAHDGLGRAYQALGEPTRARTHLERALSIYRDLGLPEADAVRTRLAALNHASARPGP